MRFLRHLVACLLIISMYNQPYTPKELYKEFGSWSTLKSQAEFPIGLHGNEMYEGDHEDSLHRTIKVLMDCKDKDEEPCVLLYFQIMHEDGTIYVLYSLTETV